MDKDTAKEPLSSAKNNNVGAPLRNEGIGKGERGARSRLSPRGVVQEARFSAEASEASPTLSHSRSTCDADTSIRHVPESQRTRIATASRADSILSTDDAHEKDDQTDRPFRRKKEAEPIASTPSLGGQLPPVLEPSDTMTEQPSGIPGVISIRTSTATSTGTKLPSPQMTLRPRRQTGSTRKLSPPRKSTKDFKDTHIRVGPEYQAELPALDSFGREGEVLGADVLWDPSSLGGGSSRSQTCALSLLTPDRCFDDTMLLMERLATCNYDAGAVRASLNLPRPSNSPRTIVAKKAAVGTKTKKKNVLFYSWPENLPFLWSDEMVATFEAMVTKPKKEKKDEKYILAIAKALGVRPVEEFTNYHYWQACKVKEAKALGAVGECCVCNCAGGVCTVTCDGCSLGFHPACLNLPRNKKNKPKGDWLCDDCVVQKREQTRTRISDTVRLGKRGDTMWLDAATPKRPAAAPRELAAGENITHEMSDSTEAHQLGVGEILLRTSPPLATDDSDGDVSSLASSMFQSRESTRSSDTPSSLSDSDAGEETLIDSPSSPSGRIIKSLPASSSSNCHGLKSSSNMHSNSGTGSRRQSVPRESVAQALLCATTDAPAAQPQRRSISNCDMFDLTDDSPPALPNEDLNDRFFDFTTSEEVCTDSGVDHAHGPIATAIAHEGVPAAPPISLPNTNRELIDLTCNTNRELIDLTCETPEVIDLTFDTPPASQLSSNAEVIVIE